MDELWETSDYVIIATPMIPYSEAVQFGYNDNKEFTDFSNISLSYSFSVRPFKVSKVYKGNDFKLKEVNVCEHVLVDGNEMKVMPGSYPTQQGDKYILFLRRSNSTEERYFPLINQGKYNLKNSKNEQQEHIDKNMLKQIKEKFKEELKKTAISPFFIFPSRLSLNVA